MIYKEHIIRNDKSNEIAYVEESKLNYYVTIRYIGWEYPYIMSYKVPKKNAKNPYEAYKITTKNNSNF